MEKINYLTCRSLNTTENKISSSEILIAGDRTSKFVSGQIFQGAFKFGNFYLLLLTDGYDYQECVTVSLLNKNLDTLDSAVIGMPEGIPLATDRLMCLQSAKPNLVSFCFGDNIWWIRILPKPVLWIPWLPDTIGVWRYWKKNYPFYGFSRHFIVERKQLEIPTSETS